MNTVVQQAKEIYDRRMTAEQVDFTNAWWASLVKDQERLIAWIHKLYNSELYGCDEYSAFITRYNPEEVTRFTLRAMAQDEMRHAGYLDQVLGYWGQPQATITPRSQYWNEMQQHAIDFRTACAVKYFGEALAAERFNLLVKHPDTPDDLFHAFRWIAPDEERHCQIMFVLAGHEAIVEMEKHHKVAVANLLQKKS